MSERVGKFVGRGKYYGPGKEFPFPPQNANVELRLGLMDKYGVDVQAISQTTPILLGWGPEEAAEVCRMSNEDNFALCKAHPKRFVNICILSLLDVKSALKELDRCISELDCRGVTISSSQNGKGLDSREYDPFYEKVAKHDLPILIHGTHWECSPLMDMEHAWRFLHVFGWDYDGTQAVWRLIFGGVLDRFPTLKIVTHHLGNYIPFFKRRIEINFDWMLKDKVPRHITEYWKNIYGDTAIDGTVGAMPCGYGFFGSERMLYGSDYPFGPEAGEDFIRENLFCVKSMVIPPEEKARILGGNARKMLKIA
jgi:aminocarboxymuconate-semialdehyde decarboxylase